MSLPLAQAYMVLVGRRRRVLLAPSHGTHRHVCGSLSCPTTSASLVVLFDQRTHAHSRARRSDVTDRLHVGQDLGEHASSTPRAGVHIVLRV